MGAYQSVSHQELYPEQIRRARNGIHHDKRVAEPFNRKLGHFWFGTLLDKSAAHCGKNGRAFILAGL